MAKGRYAGILCSTAGILILIFDAKTAVESVSSGIDLCIRTVIPSLFPFFVLSIILTASLTGISLPFLGPLGRICGIPKGAESILLTAFLGGYPVGAQSVAQSRKCGQLSKSDAQRMMGFCSNAGPAFIFGITGPLFDDPAIPWCIWFIQIISAIMVGALLPGKSKIQAPLSPTAPIPLPKALERAIKIMSGVCGWVILFRMIITLFYKRVIHGLPTACKIIFAGLLELTNGCCQLQHIDSHVLRFWLCNIFLSFGGLCVGMQTISVTGDLGTGLYFPGKILQTFIACLLSCSLSAVLFPQEASPPTAVWCGILLLCLVFFPKFIRIGKNNSRNTAAQRV